MFQNLTTGYLFLNLFVSAFGLAYFVYGKKQKKLVPSLAGIALMFYPYFVNNMILFVIIGLVLLVVPFIIRE